MNWITQALQAHKSEILSCILSRNARGKVEIEDFEVSSPFLDLSVNIYNGKRSIWKIPQLFIEILNNTNKAFQMSYCTSIDI